MANTLMRHGAALVALIVALVAGADAARADQAVEAARCERAIAHGARTVGVPEPVLRAIALTETGRRLGGRVQPWPWAVNREGQGYWFASRDEALAFARQSLAERRPSFDVSCFQINYRHHGANFPSVEAMFDPDTAAVYAASFLRDLYGEFGDWSRAAGAYHSRTPHFASRYRERFDRILAGLGGGGAAPDGAFVAASAPAADPPRPIPQREVKGPRIIAVTTGATDGSLPAVAHGGRDRRGIIVVTVEEAEPPLVAGRRL